MGFPVEEDNKAQPQKENINYYFMPHSAFLEIIADQHR